MKLPELSAARTVFGYLRSYLPKGRDKDPIDTLPALEDFLASQSAYIAQTSLYGYLKTRMGTRYPELFQDDNFVVSINRAKWEVCAACLSDLTVFAIGHCALNGKMSSATARQLARDTYAKAADTLFVDPEAVVAREAAVLAFEARASEIDWQTIGEGERAFDESQLQLVASAPVSDDFKARDSEIIMNSIRFRWREVRQQFRRRAVPDAIVAGWRGVGNG